MTAVYRNKPEIISIKPIPVVEAVVCISGAVPMSTESVVATAVYFRAVVFYTARHTKGRINKMWGTLFGKKLCGANPQDQNERPNDPCSVRFRHTTSTSIFLYISAYFRLFCSDVFLT